MLTALHEINTLQKGKIFQIDPRNHNRYRILVNGESGKTAYCFSTPIYTKNEGKLVSRKFEQSADAFVFHGSNALVTAHNGAIVLKNSEGSAVLRLGQGALSLQGNYLCADRMEIHPTFNGVEIRVSSPTLKFAVSTDKLFSALRCNTKSFAIMKEKFRPFLAISALIATDQNGRIFPVELQHRKIDPQTYEVELSAVEGDTISFEVNLYEAKLFQDTTVESARPKENNAFGGIAFLGRTEFMGEQWLYARPDFSKISELYEVNIKKVLLHLPCFWGAETQISVFAPAARFCSFGSTWNNKIALAKKVGVPSENGNYITVDMTDIFTDTSKGRLRYTEGLIFKPASSGEEFITIATSDNYGHPLILEVQYE